MAPRRRGYRATVERAGLVAALCLASFPARRGLAQGSDAPPPPDRERPAASLPEQVEVAPAAGDELIARRLTRVLAATGWFRDVRVRVDEGVVFLSGRARDQEAKDWAGALARRTRDVVAVVNQLDVAQPRLWDAAPIRVGLRALWRDLLAAVPGVLFGVVVLLASVLLARLASMAVRVVLRNRLPTPVLARVSGYAVGTVVVILASYFVLRVAGLTRLAVTVLGGTGIIGLVLGIAFRDITENFLASVFLSVQRPFRSGDLIEVAAVTGYVQRLTIRTTVLMTLDGNHVQIPNSTVYKSTLRNFSSNPNRREDFVIGIAYEAPIADAQEVAMGVLTTHPAVLRDPEPWVLVDGLGPATVNLRVYFWLDGSRHSWLKVRSSVIRLVKRAFAAHGIRMPDSDREVVFPDGVPLRWEEQAARAAPAAEDSGSVSTQAEQGLATEAGDIGAQASRARSPEPGEDLLR